MKEAFHGVSKALNSNLLLSPKVPIALWPTFLSPGSRIISRGPLTRLCLPPVNQLSKYLHEKIGPFFKDICSSTDNPKCLHIDEEYDPETLVRLSIEYDPKGKGIFGTCPSCTTITDVERHILWRRLNDKSTQLAGATEECPRIIIVCDGGCNGLRIFFGGGSYYQVEDVIKQFWHRPELSKDNCWSSTTEIGISAVVVISVDSSKNSNNSRNKTGFILNACLYHNPYCKFNLSNKDVELISEVVASLPLPLRSANNALRLMHENSISLRHLGYLNMKQSHTEQSVEMSAIDLLKILSGELSISEFCRSYTLPVNPFKEALTKFQTIKSLKISAADNRDDDKVTIVFGPCDAAVGPFTVPAKDEV